MRKRCWLTARSLASSLGCSARVWADEGWAASHWQSVQTTQAAARETQRRRWLDKGQRSSFPLLLRQGKTCSSGEESGEGLLSPSHALGSTLVPLRSRVHVLLPQGCSREAGRSQSCLQRLCPCPAWALPAWAKTRTRAMPTGCPRSLPQREGVWSFPPPPLPFMWRPRRGNWGCKCPFLDPQQGEDKEQQDLEQVAGKTESLWTRVHDPEGKQRSNRTL